MLVSLLCFTLLMASGLVGALATHPVAAAPAPSLIIDAPQQVQLGEPIDITLAVQGLPTLAGFEGLLLFDPTAASLSGLALRDNDIKRLRGDDVQPLGPVAVTGGIAFGFYSCPRQSCLDQHQLQLIPGGTIERFQLATISVVAQQPGLLELTFDALKFVDGSGRTLTVATPTRRILIQVGAKDQTLSYPAPTAGWVLAASAPEATGTRDLTGDGQVTHADAMEVALTWALLREQGLPCSSMTGTRFDTNGDGCIDVSDAQYIVASARGRLLLAAPEGDIVAPRQGSDTLTNVSLAVDSVLDHGDADPTDGICQTVLNQCTLRAAIQSANTITGPNTIAFAIPGSGPHTILLGATLPALNDESGSTTIDGYTQPGAQPNTDALVSNAVILVEVTGPSDTHLDGLPITSANNVVRGVAFFQLKRSLWLVGSGAHDNLIIGNFVGTNSAGTAFQSTLTENGNGVHLQQGAARNQIGGTSPADRNVISGNSRHGVATYHETTDDNIIINNLIGLNPSGDARLPNVMQGVDLNFDSAENLVGGTAVGERNVLSGNGESGVEISHSERTRGNRVIGNFIGTDVTGMRGTEYSHNVGYGVNIEDGPRDNIIARNIVGNNQRGGIRVKGFLSRVNHIFDNWVGLAPNGDPIPNQIFGIEVNAVQTLVGPGNQIAHNPVGIRITEDNKDFNTITQNSIFSNTTLGIDLAPLGLANESDPGDIDVGPNQQLDAPVLTSATFMTVTGTTCITCTIELFIADDSVFAQGITFLGAARAKGDGSFAITVAALGKEGYLTATATDARGNTSEFAAPLADFCPNVTAPRGVGIEDIQTVSGHWSQNSSDPAWQPHLDLDGDGDIDVVDTLKVVNLWGSFCTR